MQPIPEGLTMPANHQGERWARERADLIADVGALLGSGVCVDQLVLRLGTNRVALARRLQRGARHDLARIVDRVAVNQRWPR